MKFNILLFGITKDIIGGETVETLIKESTVGDLRKDLIKKYPKLKDLNSLMIAVNNEYAEDDQILTEKDEIAIIPPVSGG